MPKEQKMDDPTVRPGERRTSQYFADIVDQFGQYIVAMHGPDRAEMSSILLVDGGSLISRAIVSGRQPDGWLRREDALAATRKALAQRYRDLSSVQLDDVTGEMGSFYAEVGEGIPENRPY